MKMPIVAKHVIAPIISSAARSGAPIGPRSVGAPLPVNHYLPKPSTILHRIPGESQGHFRLCCPSRPPFQGSGSFPARVID